MKRSLAMMLALIMVCALPGIASANGNCSINGAGITSDAVFIELENITFKNSVQVKLFSDKTLLTTATLQGVTPGSYGFLTCCIATETADEYWALTPWTPKDDVVPDKAVLFVDGHKLDEKTFTLNAEDWANLPGTVLPPSGSIESAVITHDNGVLKNAVSVELKDVTFAESVAVRLYSDGTLLTTATLQGVTPGSHGFLTCCIATETADANWALTPWIPRDKIVPNKAVLFVDGNELDTKKLTLDAEAWAALPGTVPYSGSINGAGITPDAVFIELEDITFEKSVQVKLFSDETLLTTATLNEGKLDANTPYQFVTCCIPTVGEDNAWSLTTWTPKDDVVPNKAVLFVDDHEMDMKEFKLDAKEWADLPGTAFPYSGGTTGGGSHWHPPVTPAPVPVVVIPPKTGDMTLLQYIARLLGLVR